MVTLENQNITNLQVPADAKARPFCPTDVALLTAADQIVKDWADPQKRNRINVEDVAQLANEIHSQLIGINRNFEKDFALHAIRIGRLLLIVQKKVGKAREAWAYTHLKCGNEQTWRNYIELGRVNCIEKYAGFGITRVLKVIRALSPEDRKSPDPVGNFFKRHRIFFDPDEEPPYKRFNLRVDTAVALEKAKKAGLKVDPGHIATLVNNGKGLKPEFIDDALKIQNFGGDTDGYFKTVIGSGGQRPNFANQEAKGKDVRRLLAELIQTIELIMEKKIDVEGTFPEDVKKAAQLLTIFEAYLLEN
jgi:hypothetical protein